MSWIAAWTVTALLPIIASALAARRFEWQNVIATLLILGIVGAWIDLHLPE